MKIYDLITVILFVVTVIVVFWYIFGNSPTLEEGLLILALTFLFTIYGNVKKMEGDVAPLKKSFCRMEDSFQKLANDFKEHAKRRG